MSREVVPPGSTFRRAYMPGTDDPQPQTGLSGNQLRVNAITNEGTEDHDLLPSEISSTWRLHPTNPPSLIGGLAEAGSYGGPTRYPPFPPATAWSPNIPSQYHITNPYNTHQPPPNSHGPALTAPSPAPDDVPYLPQSPPGVAYGSSNFYHSPYSPVPPYSTRHPPDGPPLSEDEFKTYLETGLVPERPNTLQGRRGFISSNAKKPLLMARLPLPESPGLAKLSTMAPPCPRLL